MPLGTESFNPDEPLMDWTMQGSFPETYGAVAESTGQQPHDQIDGLIEESKLFNILNFLTQISPEYSPLERMREKETFLQQVGELPSALIGFGLAVGGGGKKKAKSLLDDALGMAKKAKPAQKLKPKKVENVAIPKDEKVPNVGKTIAEKDIQKVADCPAGECYSNALKAALANDKSGAKVVQGKVFMARYGDKRDHSWVEIGDKVYDPTIDLISSKKEFYNSIAGPEVVNILAPQEAAVLMLHRGYKVYTPEDILSVSGAEALQSLQSKMLASGESPVGQIAWKTKHWMELIESGQEGGRLLDVALAKYGKKAHAQIRSLLDENKGIALDHPERAHYVVRGMERMARMIEKDPTKAQRLIDLMWREDYLDTVAPLMQRTLEMLHKTK